ncbi:TIM barrel protein [Acinetobacter qingfengensis]|uniref:Hydroxypyruvate isomerase n=1 Tax=Acinetobacter qingfengensis TaxID=1262585 RepID=A0A1E7QXC5_9GAMM|nr:TIM barrel protein [Acinetobacter qingfengensis]KAA8731635.1 TIM barrel protein [Acinetobacter qingfengensis]OEY91738.1 hydroxypyruvate isomerase [Acinetobacter qingfengensis]
MLNLAVNLSLIFTEVPLIERFALAKQQGFQAVEIQFPYELPATAIQQQLDEHDLDLVLINVPTGDLMQGGNGLAGIPGLEIEFAKAVKQAMEYALALQVPTVNILAGKQPENADLLPCLKTLADNLRFASDAFQNAGITPVIEMINNIDMPRFLIQNLAQGQEMLEAVHHPALKLQYDCYHMAMMGEDVLEGLKENLDQIAHIQFADFPYRHEPSTGIINYSALFQWIQQSTYLGYCGAEYKPSGLSADSFNWLKSCI